MYIRPGDYFFVLFRTTTEGALASLGQDHFDVFVRAWDDVHRNQLGHALGCCGAGVRGGFDCAYVTAHHDGHVTAANVL